MHRMFLLVIKVGKKFYLEKWPYTSVFADEPRVKRSRDTKPQNETNNLVTDGGLKSPFQTTTLPVFWFKIKAECPEIAKTALKPLFLSNILCLWSRFSAVTATNTHLWSYGHKEHTSGVIVSHHPEMTPARCRETSSGLPLTRRNDELYFCALYICFYAGRIILFSHIYNVIFITSYS